MPAVELLLRALSQRDVLTEAERTALSELSRYERTFRKGQSIIGPHSEPQEAGLLLEGIAGREVVLQSGSRQLTALHVPGDFLDLDVFLLKRIDHGVVALTDCRTVQIQHAALRRLTEESPHLTRLLWMTAAIDAAIQRHWAVSMGRRDALEQMAHLVCELYLRLRAVGLAADRAMQLPLSQAVLADVMGVSPVHVNRTLRALRARRLLTWRGSRIEIQDFDGLARLAGFDPTYLNLMHRPR
ncbi:Crp/Fnr family transcriptional regulator [Bosea sp. CS1GBMeth4]|uniref:Crp/Fnr family transcriptional regulator n=1 Tax=Bosea sp. CS1GBMeth4 TaxID=1892849 RepID=UPI0016468BF1|nr:Crp/Fnr family transcriptional regulator [Bosea sp. CS1GBMeth4]